MRTVIVGDLHGRFAKARELFGRVGVIECPSDDPADDVRVSDVRVIQLGDAVSLGYGEVEAGFFRWLVGTVRLDEMLLGNHELPAVWWHPNNVMFTGYYDRSEIHDEIDQDAPRGTGPHWATNYPWEIGRDREVELLVRGQFAAGRYQVASSVGDWLVTHAGVGTTQRDAHGLADMTAAELTTWLNDEFGQCLAQRQPSSIFESRSEDDGGIMWLRFEHLCAEYDRARWIPQIVGHSGYAGPSLYGGLLWNIDTPPTNEHAVGRADLGGVAALVTEDDGASFTLEYVP